LGVLERRFLLRDERGVLIEDAEHLFRRVAHAIAAVDDSIPGYRREESEEVFFDLMAGLKFLPNSPTLMNAGTRQGQLAGCFVLPVEDSMESIYETLRDVALIQKSGGGTGFSFSKLRPRGDYIRSTRGSSSGPVSFMQLYDYSTQINRLGGTRAGANMGVLRFDHPDIAEFVNSKRDPNALTSFNISVMVTDAFMNALTRDRDFPLRFSPAGTATESNRGLMSARSLFDDSINAANPTPHLGVIEATNPCGEQPLLAYESCNLGSINVSAFVRGGRIDYEELRVVIGHAVHFLDNVLDVNQYPVEAVRRITLRNRKIGLGIMGFADLLVQLDVPYASNRAVSIADDLMGFIETEAKMSSMALAAHRGGFPAFRESRLAAGASRPIRNACVTTIAPTGTISLLANCSSGIEPFFALSYRREVIGETRTMDLHPGVVTALPNDLPNREAVLSEIRRSGRTGGGSAPAHFRALFATAHEIPPEWHVKIQAAFQRHVDTSVSKTINLAANATAADIDAAYRLAFELGCKGVTVFRDGSKEEQVLRAGNDGEHCPECGEPLARQAGCSSCVSCGYSVCAV
jgi:ribonucleoside-diphosphate reductase alpha chain